MKAIQLHSFGDINSLYYDEVPQPNIGDDEVLVKIHAVGLNPVDWKTRKGIALYEESDLPLILGWDLAGTVVAVGDKVARFQLNDEVYGMSAFPKVGAAYAEYAAVKENDLSSKPSNITYEEAAAIPLAALTAWQALFEIGNLVAGQSILIHAAAGGVGHFAVQLAKWKGARVIGTASTQRSTWLRELGLDQFIDYRSSDFTQKISDIDFVLDSIGGEVGLRSLKVLKNNGTLVTLLPNTAKELLAEAKKMGLNAGLALVHPDVAQLDQITALVVANKIRPYIDRVYPFLDIKDAHHYLEQGHVQGKVVLQIVRC